MTKIGRPPKCECGECSRCKKNARARARYQAMTPDERRAWIARRDKEKVRASDRERHRRDREKRLEAMREYQTSERGREVVRAGRSRWVDRNREQVRANWTTSNAIRDGKLVRQPCEVCGTTERVEAHHDDYSKPLDVRWLCKAHHVYHHTGFLAEAA